MNGANKGTARSARLIAYYLPQFHPIPENDAWWGKGFTEWTNVTKAKPLFRGHRQPRLPADLGFYDLRIPEVREAQATMARDCGVEAFCYWHYWFGNGRRILERPFEEVLSSGRPDFPFCLAWANQSWSGIWHGKPNHMLIEQRYPGKQDEIKHFDFARRAFEDPRYLTVKGCPVFSVYAPHELPDPKAFVEHWRELAIRAGFPDLYMIAITNIPEDRRLSAFDAASPNSPGDFFYFKKGGVVRHLKRRFLEADETEVTKMARQVYRKITLPAAHIFTKSFSSVGGGPLRFKYDELASFGLDSTRFNPNFIPCVAPNWDNTPRSGRNGVVVEGATPDRFGNYLRAVSSLISHRDWQNRIIFLKAWNEWAEGNYVEPDDEFGTQYIEAIDAAL